MNKYPIRKEEEGSISIENARKIIEEEEGYIAIENVRWLINAAFYDGFITAMLETPEEDDELTPAQRIQYMELAELKNAILTRRTSPSTQRIRRIKKRIALYATK